MEKDLPAPTEEQAALIDMILSGEPTAGEALAGTGKTTLLRAATTRLMNLPRVRTCTYLAYNTAMAKEAKGPGVFPPNTSVSTTHGLAYGLTGRPMAHRLRARRMTSVDVARLLGIDSIITPSVAGPVRLASGFLGGHVMRAVRRFTESDDAEVDVQHFGAVQGLDETRLDGTPVNGINSKFLAQQLVGAARKAWTDMCNPDGKLPYTHDCYLKQYALSEPHIYSDVVMLDEAQDTNACVYGIVERQRQWAQVVLVGDRYQMIYEWRGALNAMEQADVTHRGWITQSFRFGPQVAEEANLVLAQLGSDKRLIGAGPDSYVGPVAEPTAVLCRTNAGAMEALMYYLHLGKAVSLVADVVRSLIPFFEAVERLQEGKRVAHPDLAAFQTWGEVVTFVEEDPLGSDLGMLVRLVEDYSPRVLVALLNRCADESFCDMTISTAHKSKGRQWSSVKLWSDFPDPTQVNPRTGLRRTLTAEDKRLLYVAVTRARKELDVTNCRAFDLFRNPTLLGGPS